MNLLILTPLALEREAVLKHLNHVTSEQAGQSNYWSGGFQGSHCNCQAFVCETGPRESSIALATDKAINQFRPSIVFLIGIAGGIKDVEIGDIAIGTSAYSYETGKDTSEGFVYRPEVYHSSQELVALARLVAASEEWKKRSPFTDSKKVVFGPVASGNKVIASTGSEHYRNIKTHLNDTIALEMEAAGFGRAMSSYPHIHAINIRSISDLLDYKTVGDEQSLQHCAAANAAAFAFEMLYHLQPENLNLPIMSTKELVKTIYEHILPAVKSETNGFPAKGTIWERVKPLLATELNELKNDPDDEDSLTAFRIKLKRSINENEELKAELERLLQEKQGQGDINNSINITDSKNVVSGSNISVGGNFHLGDSNQTNHNFQIRNTQGNVYINIEQAAQLNAGPLKSETLSSVKMQVATNKIKPAIQTLLEHSSNDADLQNQVILLASRWNLLQREKNMNIISKSHANIETNRIRAALLDLIDEINI